MEIRVKVIPNARKLEIIVLAKNYIKVKLTSPPTKNRANKELIEVLAEYYHVNKSAIKIKRGLHFKEKLIEVVQ